MDVADDEANKVKRHRERFNLKTVESEAAKMKKEHNISQTLFQAQQRKKLKNYRSVSYL